MNLSDDARVVTLGTAPFTILHTNRGWANLTGFKFTEVANKKNSFLQGPHTNKEVCIELRDAVLAGDHVKVRILNYKKDGDPFHNTLECIPLRDSSGKLTHYCGVLSGEPVTDNAIPRIDRVQEPVLLSENIPANVVKYESEARDDREHAHKRPKIDSRMRVAEVLSNSTDPIVVTQATHPYKIMHANKPWCEMCGYTMEEVEGLTNAILQGPETDMVLVNELMSSVKRGQSGSATVVNYKKGGVRFVNQIALTPVYNEDNELEQFMALLTEVDSLQ